MVVEVAKKPKKAILFRLTFYKNDELKDSINKEFDVVGYHPDWQLPFTLQIGEKKIPFAPDEVRVTEWFEE